MPTPLTRSVVRLVNGGRDGPLVVMLEPEGIYLRRPRSRTKYGPLPYSALFLLGGKQAAEQLMRERARRKKETKLQKALRLHKLYST